MKFSLQLPLLLMVAAKCQAETRKLLVSAYSGQLTTLEFDTVAGTLTPLSVNLEGAPRPGWQTLFKNPYGTNFILSSSELWDGFKDGVKVLSVDANGTLALISRSKLGTVVTGPVALAATKSGLIVSASYSGGVNTFSMNPSTGVLVMEPLNTFRYNLTAPGPNPKRQEAAHPHHVIIDPTEKFALVPDLGADHIHIYSICPDGLSELAPVPVPPGSGPRHGVFSPAGEYYYQVNELANRVDVFSVAYNPNIVLTPVQNISTYPTGITPPLYPVPIAGEIQISGDSKYLYTSNRGDKTFPNARVAPSPSNETTQSDSITAYTVDAYGQLTFLEQFPVAGLTPRHFSLEPTNGGEYVAVATQDTGRVAVYQRDKVTGKFGTAPFASIDMATWGASQPPCVIWLD
ncbi:Lactonase, 7-bladed beta-propeller-domain-containing protein [Terfezia claveryi]|nr:Lactonase, 7-bladed beta-propeller-domain-containing protein [Terfezia claveryi]